MIAAIAEVAVQASMVGRSPIMARYVGHRGWLGVYLDIEVDWDEVADLIEDAYRTVASQRLVERLDSEE